ncbi:hypothetical protein PRK78_003771 [Emydomyces testavorans]|uniref:YDG domain-containing protein n=1 Tax=Emydomyces testavorans TaxID=2070801 RepID=A0AAF0IIN5_9EURO|nr:hypothetical protein PRK78_003771 [Emydomyces testavorans]
MSRFEAMVQTHLTRLQQEAAAMDTAKVSSTEDGPDLCVVEQPNKAGSGNGSIPSPHTPLLSTLSTEDGFFPSKSAATYTTMESPTQPGSLKSPSEQPDPNPASDGLFVESASAIADTPAVAKRAREEGAKIQDEAHEPQTTVKRAKKSGSTIDTPCTCAISSNCQRAALNNVRDCRTHLAPIPRKPKPKIGSTPTNPIPRFLSTKERAKAKRSIDEMLQILVFYKDSITTSSRDVPNIFNNMRRCAQQLPFQEVHESAIAHLQAKFLDPASGFLAIVADTSVPWDIKLDVDMLRIRWENGDIRTDLDRGLIIKTGKARSRSLDPSYKFRLPYNYIGEGELRNGQWFPWQICAIRDGAHGESEGGIAGPAGVGAVSIILSSGRGYADRDEGDVITYYGTHGKKGEISYGTKLLLLASQKGHEIRVIRSHRLPAINKYRPAEGFRYDGVYKIVGQELVDENTMLYRFDLVRLPGQTPIRYQKPEARPNEKEIEEFKKLKKLLAPQPKKDS